MQFDGNIGANQHTRTATDALSLIRALRRSETTSVQPVTYDQDLDRTNADTQTTTLHRCSSIETLSKVDLHVGSEFRLRSDRIENAIEDTNH